MHTQSLLQEAHKLLHATPTASALEAVIAQIAQRWCTSFGVNNASGLYALEREILKRITSENTAPVMLDINELLDMHAEAAIAAWFDKVQLHSLMIDPQPLSLHRYAFLQANENNDFSEYFLHPAAPFEEIAAAMAHHDVTPTPAYERRQMPRQKI